MVADAVSDEPVSALKSLITGKIQGNSGKRGISPSQEPRKTSVTQGVNSEFPTRDNRESVFGGSGILLALKQGMQAGKKQACAPFLVLSSTSPPRCVPEGCGSFVRIECPKPWLPERDNPLDSFLQFALRGVDDGWRPKKSYRRLRQSPGGQKRGQVSWQGARRAPSTPNGGSAPPRGTPSSPDPAEFASLPRRRLDHSSPRRCRNTDARIQGHLGAG